MDYWLQSIGHGIALTIHEFPRIAGADSTVLRENMVLAIISTIWGHPTPDTEHRLPKTPVTSIGKNDGKFLKDLCLKGPVRVRLKTELKTGFAKVPLAIADIKGKVEPDKYVLFNGHVDSWHKGVTDNATANACILEAARIMAKYRDHLRRGVRFVWWSGHSQGRYSGQPGMLTTTGKICTAMPSCTLTSIP